MNPNLIMLIVQAAIGVGDHVILPMIELFFPNERDIEKQHIERSVRHRIKVREKFSSVKK